MEIPASSVFQTSEMLVPPAEVLADFAPPANQIPTAQDSPSADEYLQESLKAEELYARAIKFAENGDNPQTVSHFLRAAKHAEMAREWHLAAIALHAVGDRFLKRGPEQDLPRALRMYRRAIAAYEQCGYFDESRRLEFRVSKLQLVYARSLKIPREIQIEMLFNWAVTGFGYSPFRVLVTGVVIILVFAIVYWEMGGLVNSDLDPINDFGSAAYFSGSTFLTMSYGDVMPVPNIRWLTVLEGLLGLTTISFFVVVLSNRLRH